MEAYIPITYEDDEPLLKYVIDTDGAVRVIQHTFVDSPDSDQVLCPIIHQKKTCVCYSLTTAEATRAAIYLKKNINIPYLSAMEIYQNCYGKSCTGHHVSAALNWVCKNGLGEAKQMPLDLDAKPEKGLAAGVRHHIDNFQPVRNYDPTIQAYSVRQPVIVSLSCAGSLEFYHKGLIDPYLMKQEKDCYSHSLLLTGFGYYIYPDQSRKYFWQLKNSMGKENGVKGYEESEEKGYLEVLANSSQPSPDKWVAFDPIVPIVKAPGEIYVEEDLVEHVTFLELEKFATNEHLDLIILFYDGSREDKTSFIEDFKRVSRLYLPEKDDVKFFLVNREDKRGGIQKYLSKKTGFNRVLEGQLLLRTYKHIEHPDMEPCRSLSDSGHSMISYDIDLEDMIKFLMEKVGGPMKESN